jgi:pimeloyl-ACP methyl ester carboxylesterase
MSNRAMTDHETGHAEVNGTRLYYEIAGRGQPLVLIHGFGLDNRLWDEQFRDYSRRFRVLRYDLRGFGQSQVPGEQAYRHADDLCALLDYFEMPQAVLMGLSLGGWIALNFALDYPHRVSALVLVDAILNGQVMSPEWEAEVAPIWREARSLGVEATKERWHHLAMFAAARAHPQAGPRLAQIIVDWSGWQFVNRNPETTGAAAAERLSEIQAPTLVIIGERDLADFKAMADRLLAIPLARKVVIPGAGHLPPIEAPTLLDALVLGFLESM